MLQKYSISSLQSDTNDIKKRLEQNNFIENEDYNLRNVSEVRKNNKNIFIGEVAYDF